MTKFEQQAADLSGVYLYKEGLFVRVYNERAFAFIHHARNIKPVNLKVDTSLVQEARALAVVLSMHFAPVADSGNKNFQLAILDAGDDPVFSDQIFPKFTEC